VRKSRLPRRVSSLLLVVFALVQAGFASTVHTYYVASDEVEGGHRTDVIAIDPAQMQTVDMIPDNPGTWMYHCHVDEHMEAGMVALYKVEPSIGGCCRLRA
jgi:manganese oxidase